MEVGSMGINNTQQTHASCFDNQLLIACHNHTSSRCAVLSSSASMQNGVYVPAMRTNIEEWSRRRSHARVFLDQLPR